MPCMMVIMMYFVDMTTSSAHTVTHVIPADAPVTAVTSLGDDVFVVRNDKSTQSQGWLAGWFGSNSQQIEVYDAVTFTLQRRLSVPGLGHSFGLAACASNKCLYASDFNNGRVHRVELSGSNAVTKWFVGRTPAGLTVNSAKNVLVVIRDERKIQQFTTHGTPLQTIQLQPDVECPLQVVELSNGQFVISHTGIRHRVCLLDVNGAVVRSYGGTPGSNLTKMNWPVGLAVDEDENILVADAKNNRLLVLDRSLTSAREMSVSVDGGLDGPYSLWYDKSRGRLYIGESSRCRVIIIDRLKDFAASQV